MEYTINKNAAFNSIEITFDGKPTEAVRTALKALKFRWHGVKKIWYGYSTEEAVRDAIEGKAVAIKPAASKVETKAVVNKYGVKVGDIFHASWGYDQTNNDFFQVIALVGEESVRVREVNPVCVSAEAMGWGAEDRVMQVNTHGKLLPAAHFSVHIKDQERGDLKRIKSIDGKSNPYIKIAGYANAYKCEGETKKVYESWYR